MNYKFVSTVIIAALAAVSMAKPLVSYTVSGTSGNFNLDFTVTNNLPDDIYFFGVDLSGRDITGSPIGFDPNAWTSWNNADYGGSNTNYNNNWIDLTYAQFPSGTTLGGFDVLDTDEVAPTSVQWFLYGLGGAYSGGDNFYTPNNPGFEGVSQAVPEPMPMAAMGLGLIGLVIRRRRR